MYNQSNKGQKMFVFPQSFNEKVQAFFTLCFMKFITQYVNKMDKNFIDPEVKKIY